MRLSQALSERSLGARCSSGNSGSEANEAAIKLARRAKPRGEIVVLREGFHGRTYGALSATAPESKQAPFRAAGPRLYGLRQGPGGDRRRGHRAHGRRAAGGHPGESGVLIVPTRSCGPPARPVTAPARR